ncbi:protein of unknown function [Modicisalibacter ilicicola DSM 19980]|uniref:DUF349 domain-containing protein n=1 Tax=Modicisalibacter ilicicola DSM 19980 TaxID=1121942 RepID=A0A1M5E9L6_9GAMM|nr:DUF349 domain-containing protein [Halomonas ilicicola]SHF75938.1 protein of unknown function [Halomonas ilicicola DSM 19980]
MSGFFRRFFAPRWQHRDPAIRRQAVARLDADQPQDRERLERLAGDDHASVRQVALARLTDPAQLLRLMKSHDSPELRARLEVLLIGRPGAPPLSTRLSLVGEIDDRQLLSRLALEGDNQELRLAALERIQDEETLIHQAIENGIAAVRHAAAKRVTTEEGLSRLSRGARRDKQVARLARERLNRLREDAAQTEAQRARRERILEALEQHARHAWEPLYAGRYRHLHREWEALGDLPTNDQELRFQEASLRCRKIISDHEAQHEAIASADRRRSDADDARRTLIEALEEDLASLRQESQITEQDLASLNAHKRLLANRWQTLSDQHAPDVELSTRYTQALAEQDRINQAWKRLEQNAQRLSDALGRQDTAALRQTLKELDWPDGLPPSPLLKQVHHCLADDSTAESDEQKVARFEGDLKELERLLERGAFKPASRLHHSLRQRSESLPADRHQAYQPTLRRLGARLAELRDWRSFVAGPKRDQLCQAIDELAENTTLSDGELDRRHRQLVKEWKDLGDAAIDRELSTRFRNASERIHERLGSWREAQNEERQRNLKARVALCEQLENLIEHADPHADPDALRQIRDRAREQWRLFSPVPRGHGESLGHRFGRIRHALQTLIDRRAQEIAAAKQALVEEARQLRSDTTPASKRAEKAKDLQRRWRELGRAPKGEEQALWREFRGLCDGIFAARESERDDRAQRAREHLDAMQALIERLDAWQPSSSDEAQVLDQAVAEADTLEPLPGGRRSEGMRRRWTGIVRSRREQLARLALSEEALRWRRLGPLLEAHLKADARLLEGHAAEDVEAPFALDDAMQRAQERRNAARHAPPDEASVEAALARSRVHLTLLAGGGLDREDEPLRLAIQVKRLNDAREQALSKTEELHAILCDILATGPVRPSLWTREAGELDRLLNQLASSPTP